MSTQATHTQQQEGARFTRDADTGADRRHTPASILARLDSGFLIVAAVIGQFGIETRNKRFEEVSP